MVSVEHLLSGGCWLSGVGPTLNQGQAGPAPGHDGGSHSRYKLLMCERAGFSHPVKEVLRKCTSPLILVQFLKRSMLEAFTAMVLIKAPTPMPSQTGEENTVSLVL